MLETQTLAMPMEQMIERRQDTFPSWIVACKQLIIENDHDEVLHFYRKSAAFLHAFGIGDELPIFYTELLQTIAERIVITREMFREAFLCHPTQATMLFEKYLDLLVLEKNLTNLHAELCSPDALQMSIEKTENSRYH